MSHGGQPDAWLLISLVVRFWTLREVEFLRIQIELSPNFDDGRTGQAAAVVGCRSVGLAMTSIPSLNVTPRTSFGNWLWPSRRRQLFCAPSTSLKTIASAVPFDRQPFDRMGRWGTGGNGFSRGFGVRNCFQCSAGESEKASRVSRSLLRQSAAFSYFSA